MLWPECIACVCMCKCSFGLVVVDDAPNVLSVRHSLAYVFLLSVPRQFLIVNIDRLTRLAAVHFERLVCICVCVSLCICVCVCAGLGPSP